MAHFEHIKAPTAHQHQPLKAPGMLESIIPCFHGIHRLNLHTFLVGIGKTYFVYTGLLYTELHTVHNRTLYLTSMSKY